MKKGIITLVFKAIALGLSIASGVLFVMEQISDHNALGFIIFAVIALAVAEISEKSNYTKD